MKGAQHRRGALKPCKKSGLAFFVFVKVYIIKNFVTYVALLKKFQNIFLQFRRKQLYEMSEFKQ